VKIERHQAETRRPAIPTRLGSWTYSDPVVHQLALRLYLRLRVNLADIDDWIEAEDWSADSETLDLVLGWRHRLIHAKSDDAAEGWGRFLLTLVQLNRRERFLQPLALIGRDWRHRLPKPGQSKTLRAAKTSGAQRKSRDDRIRTMAQDGKSKVEIADANNVSVRQVYRILQVTAPAPRCETSP
jgi:hypothetical protein